MKCQVVGVVGDASREHSTYIRFSHLCVCVSVCVCVRVRSEVEVSVVWPDCLRLRAWHGACSRPMPLGKMRVDAFHFRAFMPKAGAPLPGGRELQVQRAPSLR